jgi:hypothetical protein
MPAVRQFERRAGEGVLGDANAVTNRHGTLVVNLVAEQVVFAKVVLQPEFKNEQPDSPEHESASFRLSRRPIPFYAGAAMPNRRVLRVVPADVAEPLGDIGFVISEFYFGGLLAQVGNRLHRFVTGTVVSALDAAALAAAIEKIEPTPGWEVARAMNGDPSGEGATAFCVWLRQGAFEIVEDSENSAETP